MTARPAPYPPDTRAKGWRFELDMERARQSDTWAIAAPDARPWLLMLWATAWEQTPCGSLPNDDELIAARIGMPAKLFAKHRAVLLRKWWLADDGRLYHAVLVQRALEMMKTRRSESDRKAAARAREAARMAEGVPPDSGDVPVLSHGTEAGLPPESGTGTGTGTKESQNPSNLSVATALPPEDRMPPQLSLVEAQQPKPKGPPDCPHLAVLALWSEALPAMPRHLESQWKGTRSAHLRARWRETATEKGWTDEAQGLSYFRKLFVYVGQSAFLTGKAKPRGDGRPFVAELEWLVSPSNWAKVHEGKYHTEAA